MIEKDLIAKYGIIENIPDTELLDISETIKELSYLTHSHFRYYGKFPSKLASYFIDTYSDSNSVLLDNYVGSGTGLVEAKLKGIPSYGVDINPLAVLASNVKTTNFKEELLKDDLSQIIEKVKFNYSDSELEEYLPQWSSLDKWFEKNTSHDLAFLKKILSEHNFHSKENKELFLLCFLGIVRRVSNAYDGEVRPHVKPGKRIRDVRETFIKKINEMIFDSIEFSNVTKKKVSSRSYIAGNTDLSKLKKNFKNNINLVLSHPPYLNCFDYLPVFSLELQWSSGIPEVWGEHDLKTIRSLETKSWPATNEKILFGYFDELKLSYTEVYNLIDKGSICGIVIGDSTIRGELIRVHKILASICTDIGFDVEKMIYRTTHYATGKYSYQAKANYHGEGEEKKDGIIVLRKR